jgi:hypothetical protein
MAQAEGIVEEKTLVKKSLDANIGTITLDNPAKTQCSKCTADQRSARGFVGSDKCRGSSNCIAGAQGGEGLVGWARCPGIANQRPRSIDI